MPTVVFTFDVMCLFDERKEAIFFIKGEINSSDSCSSNTTLIHKSVKRVIISESHQTEREISLILFSFFVKRHLL